MLYYVDLFNHFKAINFESFSSQNVFQDICLSLYIIKINIPNTFYVYRILILHSTAFENVIIISLNKYNDVIQNVYRLFHFSFKSFVIIYI